jgi:outer membrane protein assembly factor BamB
MKRKILESLFVLAVVILFIFPVVSSMSMRSFSSRDNYNIYHHQSDVQKTSWYIQHPYDESSMMNDGRSPVVINEKSVLSTGGPMNSSWPMYCHDVRHTGQSPYNTINTTGEEKWLTSLGHWIEGSPVIDKNGVIYVGGDDFFAVYPNGTIKWVNDTGMICSAPAIDENGIIYVGSIWAYPNNYLYAFYPDGTLKWKYATGDSIYSSPAIGNDGTIYFGDANANINALYPNGTLRWRYQTLGAVLSSPAIGSDGTVYCGSHDGGLYALYPNNGTMKWRFGTGYWVRTAPCIADDGTIYCVSLDNYLYAVYPNGTMKWRTNVGAGTSPTIGQDGTVYAGWNVLHAVNPTNGSIKWIFNPGPDRCIEGGTPAHSADGTIYCGVTTRLAGINLGGEIIAINPNGTEQWRSTIADYAVESAPAISEDGTVYIGSSWNPDGGYLHAFGPGEPKKIEIQQPVPGKLYLFGLGMGNTLLGNTVIIGSVKVKVHAYSEDQLEGVYFYIDGKYQYNVTTPPFEWNMNNNYGTFFHYKHTITVGATYKGGCTWSESMDVMYFHLLKN